MKIGPDKKRRSLRPRLPLLSLLVAVSTLLASTVARVEGNQAPVQTGVTEGVLVAKGEAWIAVRADGAREATRLVPRWIGGTPRQGGGLDKNMLQAFRQLVIGSRLKVAWLRDEHLRVVDIQVLQLPGGDDANAGGDGNNGNNDDADDDDDGDDGAGGVHHGDDGDNGGVMDDDDDADDDADDADGDDGDDGDDDGNDNNVEQPGDVEQEREGTLEGVVMEKGLDWIVVAPDGDDATQRFVPRWIGGTPAQGGGFDPEVISAIEKTPLNTRVHVEWQRDEEHLRVVALRSLPQPEPMPEQQQPAEH